MPARTSVVELISSKRSVSTQRLGDERDPIGEGKIAEPSNLNDVFPVRETPWKSPSPFSRTPRFPLHDDVAEGVGDAAEAFH